MNKQPLKIVENSEYKMPCNIEAEQAVIGSILVSNEIYDEISPIIDSNKFSVASGCIVIISAPASAKLFMCL